MKSFEKTKIVKSYSSDVIIRKIKECKNEGWIQSGQTIHQKDSNGNQIWIAKFVKEKN